MVVQTESTNGVDLLEGASPGRDDASERLQREGERLLQLDKDAFENSVVAKADGRAYDEAAVAAAMRRLGIPVDKFKATHDTAVANLLRRREYAAILAKRPAMEAERIQRTNERAAVNALIAKLLEEPNRQHAKLNADFARLDQYQMDVQLAEQNMLQTAPDRLLSERNQLARQHTATADQLYHLRREALRLSELRDGLERLLISAPSDMRKEEYRDGIADSLRVAKDVDRKIAETQGVLDKIAARDAELAALALQP